MNRRRFLATTLAASLAVRPRRTAAADASPNTAGWRVYEVTTRVTLPDAAGPARLWLPLAQTTGGYQTALALRWKGTGRTELTTDARYGAPVLRTRWEETDPAPRELAAVQTVAVRDRVGASALLPLTEAERRFWTAPTASAPLDGAMVLAAERITAGKDAPRQRLRAIYDWVVDHTHRDPDVPGCGRGDVAAMLSKDQPGGKCADINGLLVGLARATGLPARDVYGVRVGPSDLFPSLGASGGVSKAQHCRAEVFLDGEGWFPVDPADVAKVVLTEKLAPGSPEVRALRERLFGSWEMNWVGYNSATDLTLPGGEDVRPDYAFLMYPCAFTASGECPCTDPARFRYAITAREVPLG